METTAALKRTQSKGFTIPEVAVASAFLAILFSVLLGGISFGLSMVQAIKEDVRATQILLEKAETIRLYTWDQASTPGFIPQTFEASYFPNEKENPGLTYYGALKISDPDLTENYRGDLKHVTIRLQWNSGGRMSHRKLNTFIGRNGLQQYIY